MKNLNRLIVMLMLCAGLANAQDMRWFGMCQPKATGGGGTPFVMPPLTNQSSPPYQTYTITSAGSPAPPAYEDYYPDRMAWNLFDLADSSYGMQQAQTNTWVVLDMGTSHTMTGYKLKSTSTGFETGMSKNWTIRIGNDTNALDVADTQTNQTAWGIGEVRTYVVNPQKAGRYVRFDSNTDGFNGLYTFVQELTLTLTDP
jgi:hypothetical protein